VTPLVLLASLVLWRLTGLREGVRVAALVGFNALLVAALKLAFARPRPPGAEGLELSYSFPSGHTATAAVLACILGWFALKGLRARRWAVALVLAAFAWVALMAWSRIVLDVHYFSDVVGGAGVGLAVGGFGMAAARVLTTMWDLAGAPTLAGPRRLRRLWSGDGHAPPRVK